MESVLLLRDHWDFCVNLLTGAKIRLIYTKFSAVSLLLADFAASLDSGCFHPVTVKGRTYMVHRYEGPLNKIDNAVVLLSYPVGAFGKKNALRVFLCSDVSLSDETILEYYTHRWSIEVLFRSHKRYLGLKTFMVRTVIAFDRLLLILALPHFFATRPFFALSLWPLPFCFRLFLKLLIYRYRSKF